jgi:hypothetical protein
VSPTPAAQDISAQRASTRLRAGLTVGWSLFCALMIVVGVHDHLRSGGTHPFHSALVEASSMASATVVVVTIWRNIPRFDAHLAQPLQWFLRAFAPLPLLAPAFVTLQCGVRRGVCALSGEPLHQESFSSILLHESVKFALYYLLLGGVIFGLRSHLAWSAERLRAERLLRLSQQAQINQLTQQLQPHFLFNALNTISSLIASDPKLADELLMRLAALLRAKTDVMHSPVQPLSEELKLLEAYAAIMVERFADRVAIDWKIDGAARACEVPTLCLQPLLENCFRHVVERRRQPTRIVVRAERVGDRLRIAVEDDGGELAAPAVFGVGLGNLQSRLDVLHGASAQLTLSTRAEGGVSAVVELPCAS